MRADSSSSIGDHEPHMDWTAGSSANREEKGHITTYGEAEAHCSFQQRLTSSRCTERPTQAELQEALDVIKMMKETNPPIVKKRGQPPKPNVVACAIALQRGERFADGAVLKIDMLMLMQHTVRVQLCWK